MEQKTKNSTKFLLTMMCGYGANYNQLEKTFETLKRLSLKKEKFLLFLRKNYVFGTFESYGKINYDIALKNFLYEKLSYIIHKEKGVFMFNPLELEYTQKGEYLFKNIEKSIEILESKPFKNSFVKNFCSLLKEQALVTK